MKPKILKVRGVAIQKKYDSINDELLGILNNIFTGDWQLKEELNFLDAYKSNKRGSHFDIYLGDVGTIIFRPYHYIDGTDNWCYFDLKRYSMENTLALAFYQWSSKRESKMEMWSNGEHLVTATQKKTQRIKGDKTLIKGSDVYDSTNFYIKNIVGLNVEEMTEEHKIYRCER